MSEYLLCFRHPLEIFFIRHFILNGKIDLLLTLSYQRPFVVSVPVICFQISTTKLTLCTNMGLQFLYKL